MITDKVGGSSAKPEVSKQSKVKWLKHKVSGYKSQSKRISIAGCRLLLRTLIKLQLTVSNKSLITAWFTLWPDKRLALEMSSSLSPVSTVANLINTVDAMYHCMGFGLIMIFKCSWTSINQLQPLLSGQ